MHGMGHIMSGPAVQHMAGTTIGHMTHHHMFREPFWHRAEYVLIKASWHVLFYTNVCWSGRSYFIKRHRLINFLLNFFKVEKFLCLPTDGGREVPTFSSWHFCQCTCTYIVKSFQLHQAPDQHTARRTGDTCYGMRLHAVAEQDPEHPVMQNAPVTLPATWSPTHRPRITPRGPRVLLPDWTFKLTSVTNLWEKNLWHLCGILMACFLTCLKLNLLRSLKYPTRLLNLWERNIFSFKHARKHV